MCLCGLVCWCSSVCDNCVRLSVVLCSVGVRVESEHACTTNEQHLRIILVLVELTRYLVCLLDFKAPHTAVDLRRFVSHLGNAANGGTRVRGPSAKVRVIL